MLTKSEVLRKTFTYICVVFVVIFFSFIFSGNFIYAISGQFVENYLTIYTNSHDLLLQGQIPMWSWNFFLGGNFLGAQNLYSIYNPFFWITMLFSSSTLPFLYFPLLFLKSCLAAGALYLYMKETKWFSLHTTTIASLLYIFNGWYFTNLNEFVTIDLLVFVPLVLYGVEKMLTSGKKRYFVATFTLLLISHFTFLLMFVPFLLIYIFIRVYVTHQSEKNLLYKDIKNFILSAIIILGVNMVFILPLIMASNTVQIEVQNGITLSSLLALAVKGLFPPLHENYAGTATFLGQSHHLSLYQSVLVLLLAPQFIKLVNKKARKLTIFSYIGLLLFVFLTQSMQLVNVTSLATLNMNVLSLVLILFNSLLIAYVLNDTHKLDLKLLKRTSFGYKILLLLILGIVFVYEYSLNYDGFTNFTTEAGFSQLISMTPYFMIYLIMILAISLYCFILREIVKEDHHLRGKVIFVVLMLECVFTAYMYFETNSQKSNAVVEYVKDNDYIINETYAVADYIQTIDPEFYRIINSYETQYNEPIYRGYNGFSIGNRALLAADEFDWMLDENVTDALSVSATDYMVTTALSAKYYFTPDYEAHLPGYEYYDRIEGITIYQNNYFIPVASSMTTYVLDTDFEKLTREQKQYIFLNSMILSLDQVESLASQYRLEAYDLSTLPTSLGEIQYYQAAKARQNKGVKNVTYNQNRVVHDYVALSPTLLSYSIPYDEGWEAYANGDKLEVVKINGGFIGVEIPKAGQYGITLEYKSPGFDIGFSISSITALVILGCFYKYYEDKKKVASK